MICRVIVTLCTAAALAAPAAAQQVQPCDWQASARNLIEPWENTSRTFANGAVRLALLDTIEPSAGAFWLLILSPPHDKLGGRNCRVVGQGPDMGFSGLGWAGLEAAYDPAAGLTFTMPVTLYDTARAEYYDDQLTVILNQATGNVVAEIR